jgi:ABC-type dipeptide/oligopeptide/nickel transport system permease subunit
MADKKYKGRSLWKDGWSQLRGNIQAMLSLGVIVVFVLTAFYGSIVHWRYTIVDAECPGWLEPVRAVAAVVLHAENLAGKAAPYDKQDLERRYEAPSWDYIMGTDNLGRDVFQRLLQGTRIAFQVGVITSLIAIPLGVLLGCMAGYFGGWVDDIIVWLYSSFASIPTIYFVLSIAVVLQRGLMGVYLAIGFTTWVHLCRLIRGEVMKRKEQAYVKAARTLGFGHSRTIFRHILPNIMHIVIINFSLRFPAAISTEVILSFLGIGAQGEPSWGLMINTARFRLWYGVWWELTFTTIAIFLVVLAFNLFGDALRDALDPKLKTESGEA